MILSPDDTDKFNDNGRIVTRLYYKIQGADAQDFNDTLNSLAHTALGIQRIIINAAKLNEEFFVIDYVNKEDATTSEIAWNVSLSSKFSWDYVLNTYLKPLGSLVTDPFKELKGLFPIVVGLLLLMILAK